MIEYLETERLFLTNSRSKAGFLVSACEKAKRGELDVRGFGAIDPWRPHMKMECIPRPKIDLIEESKFIESNGNNSVNIQIMNNGHITSIQTPLTDSIHELKRKLNLEIPTNRLKLIHILYGSLRNNRTLGYYNLKDDECLQVGIKMRGGRKVKKIE